MKSRYLNYKYSLITILLLSITACGGGTDVMDDPAPPAPLPPSSASCDSSDSACGTLLLGITDADGDFLTYSVEISGIELTRADGALVSVMPTSQTVDFVNYVELSELAAASAIPVGNYTEGSITINYTNADIQVELNSVAVPAVMIDELGQPLLSQTLQLQLDVDNQLQINTNRPALLELDFNLAASHTINLDADPITITTEPYIIAEVNPVLDKEFRVRGPLIEVNEAESFFSIKVRPFHRRDGDFGEVDLQVVDDTAFEIDNEAYTGSAGLTKLAELSVGTPTVSLGTFDRESDQFTAITVLAGSSVLGNSNDAARGIIVARDGNTLTLRRATVLLEDGTVSFYGEINVLINDTTKVKKHRGMVEQISINALSIGQAVSIRGTIIEGDMGRVLDATEGAVRMHVNSISGHAISSDSTLLVMDLRALNGKAPEIFDFSGTGTNVDFDADPENYEVSTLHLMGTDITTNAPVRIRGYVTPFGTAPVDFDALTVISFEDTRSRLKIDWPDGADIVAFSEISNESLTINIVNGGEDGIYKLIQGGIRTDLASFDSAIVIQPKSERGLYTIKSGDRISAYSNFADFTVMLEMRLSEGRTIDSLHGFGGFSAESKIFTALKLAIKLNRDD
ncbi:MAG: hypothetical protein COA74_03505 [Gammaproteobacteria bacterium]|nr:MAG: hypothetical protein COA74_03505 [Gammaproteobacteria bacterium]